MGWFTCNPLFAERLERHGETSVQRPCGFGQALIGQLLTQHWGHDDYVRWLHGLQQQYTARRNALVDAILDGFDSTFSYTDANYFVAGLPQYSLFPHPKRAHKLAGGKQIGRICTFVPPTSGMFLWVSLLSMPEH